MRNSRKSNRRNQGGNGFWQSYSDMMAALLLVFILIIASASYEISVKTKDFEDQKKAFEDQKKEFEENKKKLEEMTARAKELEEQVDAIVGVQKGIVENLKDAFDEASIEGVTIDEETGAISFDSNILFEFNQKELKPEGKEYIDKFFAKYIDIILDTQYQDHVAEIIIEGHTDDDGGFNRNLELSQQRALEVAKYCVGTNNRVFKGNKKKLERAREIISVNGRGSNDLKYFDDDKQVVDKDKSRRVEIKFRLTADEMIRDMAAIFGEK